MTRRQFFAQKKRILRYSTVEIYHPSIGVKRYVRRKKAPIELILEATAPRDAGEIVEFTGANFNYVLPEQSESTVTAEIQFGQVGRLFKQELKNIRGASRAEVGEVIIREWVKGELEPDFVLRLFIRSIGVQPNGAAILASQEDPSGRGVSRIYTTTDFEGLRESL